MTTFSAVSRGNRGVLRLELAAEQRFDSLVLFVVGGLMTLGAVMVCSASVTVQGAELAWRQWWNTPLRQSVFALVGFLAMVYVAHLDYRLWAWEKRGEGWWSGLLFILAVGLLIAMLLPGVGGSRLGTQRALVVFRNPFMLSFQPAEFAKVVLVVWLAALLTRPGCDMGSLRRGFAPAIASAGILIVLTGIEDYGTAALMGVITLAMLLLARARWTHLIGTGLLGVAAGAGLLLLKPYRLQRLITFFSEGADPSAEGYQVTQSLIAIGSGGWWGRGLGAGVQKYGYLPQDNNDFIFAIVCEELGILGGLAVIGLFLLLLWRGSRIAQSALDPFGRLLAAGITLLLCLQAAFNIGVVTNSVPTKGISLPFVSAGGSGVLFLGVAAGLLAAVGRLRRSPT
ncbi:MAG: FtsW/RodA/SpoVE family cell cycle protein, partial [Phycisphaerae bacterium]